MKNVLFVCVGNSCRSQMAEGFARRYGGEVINAASAGLAAAQSIASETREVMLEKGIDLADQFPKDFEPGVAAKYDIVVNISGFLLPSFHGPEVLEWNIADPYGEALSVHREARDEIERRVSGMVAELERAGEIRKYSSDGQRIAAEGVRKPRLWQRFTRWL